MAQDSSVYPRENTYGNGRPKLARKGPKSEMIHIIYMAAGNSRRFGSNKLFYELDGKPMYRHLLERLIEIKDRYNKLKNAESNNPVIDITVVTRYREILDYCACIPDCHAVLSPDSEKGCLLYTSRCV